jgi:hypothetical protein
MNNENGLKVTGSQEVDSSILFSSTNKYKHLQDFVGGFFVPFFGRAVVKP